MTAANEVYAAQAVETVATRVSQTERERTQLVSEQRVLDKRLGAMTTQISKLKAERSTWSRDRKLQEALAESRAVATSLEGLQRKLGAIDQRLLADLKALLRAIDEELACQFSPDSAPDSASDSCPASSVDQARRGALEKLRRSTRQKLPRPARKLTAADLKVDLLADPEDLESRAAELAQGESRLRLEQERLKRRIARYQHIDDLHRSELRAQEMDVFRIDEPRRRTGKAQPERGFAATVPVSEANDKNTYRNTSHDDPVPSSPAVGSIDESDSPDSDSAIDFNSMRSDDRNSEPPAAARLDSDWPSLSQVYSDIVDPSTLQALEAAERSGSFSAKAKAANRALGDLQAQLELVRQRRLEIEKRAQELRKQR
ncbi:MAG: hypothetical protein V2A73_18740 [Pseudomonadota bacterium]